MLECSGSEGRSTAPLHSRSVRCDELNFQSFTQIFSSTTKLQHIPAKDYRERYEELTGSSLWQCPVCRQGRMLVTQILPPRQVSIKDTS